MDHMKACRRLHSHSTALRQVVQHSLLRRGIYLQTQHFALVACSMMYKQPDTCQEAVVTGV